MVLNYRWIFIVVVCGSSLGCCTHWHHLPDDCANTMHQCELLRAICNLCSSTPCGTCGTVGACGCGMQVYDDVVVLDEAPPCKEPFCCNGTKPRCCKVEPGPPPICYEPPMPPKFLPVPTHSVFTSGHVVPVADTPSNVEVGFGPHLTVPGGP